MAELAYTQWPFRMTDPHQSFYPESRLITPLRLYALYRRIVSMSQP